MILVIGCGYSLPEQAFWNPVDQKYIGIGLDARGPYQGDWTDLEFSLGF